MFLNDLVDLLHQADRLGDGDDDLLIMGDVVIRQGTALPILEPFIAHLVAANVKVPHGFGDAEKTDRAWIRVPTLLRRGGIDPDGVVRPSDPLDLGALWACVRGNEVVELG